MAGATILVVDDEPLVRWSLRQRLAADGHVVIEAETAAGALEQIASGAVDLILLDGRLPDGDGLSVLQHVRRHSPDLPVVMMTAYSTIDSAVGAMKAGAYHYIAKPFDLDNVAVTVETALETGRLRREVRAYRTNEGRDHSFDAIIGASPAIEAARTLLRRIAGSPASTVLLVGETGTGKDLAAKAIHFCGDRASRPFVNITCSALPDQLLESELFGHERGAFTDARQQKRGLLETANGGTVFLDEIGEMTPGLQAKLLRFLEEKTFKRVGGIEDLRVDVRVIAATNRDLESEVKAGRFREDLFYRLQVMPVTLPPLRERVGDIPVLADYFIDKYNREFRKHVRGLTAEATAVLTRYRWPGNVRELRNAIERAMLLADTGWLTPSLFATVAHERTVTGFCLPIDGVALEDVERQLLVQALDRARGNQTQAGLLLGINRDQVRYRIEKFGLGRRGREMQGDAVQAAHTP
jgi:two-component system response regulator AtoC